MSVVFSTTLARPLSSHNVSPTTARSVLTSTEVAFIEIWNLEAKSAVSRSLIVKEYDGVLRRSIVFSSDKSSRDTVRDGSKDSSPTKLKVYEPTLRPSATSGIARLHSDVPI